MNTTPSRRIGPIDRLTALGDWHAPRDGGLRRVGIALVGAFVLMAPVLAMGTGAWYTDWAAEEALRREAAEAALAYERLIEAAPLEMVPVDRAAHGRDVFMEVCIACHGADGRGIPRLGKTLVESDFVAGRSDDAMVAFLEYGRPTATPVAMPPRGGRPDLTDADLRDVITFVRGLQDPRRMPELPAMVMAPVVTSDAELADALTLAGGDEELAEYIASGTKLFARTCIACHGPGGVGIKGNGKTLVNNAFIQSKSDDEDLLTFIMHGRDPSDPANTTGIAMPPRGGNPALSEDDLLDIISYLRTLQPRTLGSARAGT